MNEKETKKLLNYLDNLFFEVSKLREKPIFNSQKKGAEINTKESLTSQEHYTVTDLIKTFIREKPELLAKAKEVDDDDAPDFPTVDAHDDIIDIQEKLEDAERVSKSIIQVDGKEQLQQSSKKIEEDKNKEVVVSESSSTVEK